VDFALVADMTVWPRACCACGHYGAAVDLGVDKPEPTGHLYICARCVTALLRLADSDRCPVSERDVALEVAKQATLRAELAEEDVRIGLGVRAELKQAQDAIEVLRAENLALRQAAVPNTPPPAEVFKAALNAKPKRRVKAP
jgi:hypothetical protein